MPALDFPSSPTDGQIYGNWVYNLSKQAWQSRPLTPAKTVNSPTAPTSPADGDQWFNTNTGQLFIYYTDANGSQWVESRAPITADGYISPNHLINGAFDFWQRGTSFTSSTYGADRWFHPITNATVSQETSDLPTGFKSGAKYVTTGASAFSQFNQPIESTTVISLRGKTVTVSGYVKISGSFLGNWLSQAYYSNSTDAYASQTTLVPSSSKIVATAATTTWTRFSNTFVVPVDAVGMRIENLPDTASAAGVTVRMTGIQLEEGSIATPFRRNQSNPQAELAACQRYYEKSYLQTDAPGTATTVGMITFYGTTDGSQNIVTPVQFQVPKRTSSYTLTTYSGVGTAGSADYSRNGASGTLTTTLYRANDRMFHSYCGAGGVFVAANMAFHWTCNAEL